jgi:hypothetical protein
MRTIHLSAVLALIFCVFVQPISAQQDTQVACPLATVPARVAGLDLVGWDRFPRPELGEVFRYRAVGQFGPDVFIYPADESLEKQLGDFRASLENAKSRGEFESFELRDTAEVKGISDDAPGRYALAVLRRGNQTQHSHIYLYPVGSRQVKIRISHPEGRFSRDAIQAFVDELLLKLAR